MNINIEIDVEDAKAILRNHGLTVELKDKQFSFPTHGSGEVTETIPVWCVTNPFTGEDEIFHKVISRIVNRKITSDILSIDHDFLMNTFKKNEVQK